VIDPANQAQAPVFRGPGGLTFRENCLRAARREHPAWVPLDFAMSPGFRKHVFWPRVGEGVNICEHFRFDGRWFGPGPSRLETPDWRALYYADGALPNGASIDGEWGRAWVHNPETDDDLQYFPLRNIESVEDVEAYPWPDVGAAYRYEATRTQVKAAQDRGLTAHVSGATVFESVWYLRGFEALMLDMAMDTPAARRLFLHMAERQVAASEQAARCGADVVSMGSDLAMQRGLLMSPTMVRDWVLPMLRDCIRAAKAANPAVLVDYHSCGNVVALLDDLIEAGIDILNPCQPEAMDIFELKRRYRDCLSFHGGIGVQSVLPFGTPAEVRDTVRRTIDIMGEGGGYLCCTSHMLRPEIPWENVMALIETVREYGHP